MTKKVAIIGAGPSGIVAAKALLHDTPSQPSPFHITIFEKQPQLGGLWPVSPDQKDGLVNPAMTTNGSRTTSTFSDLSWREENKLVPRAWEVGQYLERYWGIYLEGRVDGSFATEVISAGKKGDGMWVVRSRGKVGEVMEEVYNYLIVATGFFGREKIPKELGREEGVPVWHSSKIRDVRDLVTDDRNLGSKELEKRRNIVVVGGQMSGVETAAAIALQISSLTNSPGDEKAAEEWGKWTVTHVLQKPVWVMPLFFPRVPVGEEVGDDRIMIKRKNASPDFLPSDLVNYNLEWKPRGPIQNASGEISKEGARKFHGFMETFIGTDQTEYGVPVLSMSGEDVRDEPPMLTVSDYYTEFVRSGKIKVVQGSMRSTNHDRTEMEVEQSEGRIHQISDIAAVVCATGFDASASINFLPQDILEELKYDPTSDAFPLALNVHGIISPSFPSLGFVGFYRGPWWGVMEMQARFLSALWSGSSTALKALETDKTKDEMLKLRNNPRRAQFPMGDYTYLMESLAEILNIKRLEPESSTGRTGIVIPPRYLLSTANEIQKKEAATCLAMIDRTFAASSTSALFVARATFRALQGTWTLSRTITSQLATFPSGTLTGKAEFLPRDPTGEGDQKADMEYLYAEEGDFKPSWGGTMTAKRSYVYHYTEKTDSMDVWFAKGDGKSQDYFFHKLEFLMESREKRKLSEGWRARSSHLCIEDMYNVEYEFFFRGTIIDRWTSRYNVKGPKKDYTIENVYTRPRVAA